MKRTLTLLAIGVAAFLGANLNAASVASANFHLSQPTMAGERNLPAGNYTVQVVNTTSDVPVLVFQGKDLAVMVLPNHTEPSSVGDGKAEVTLQHIHDVYRMTKVSLNGHDYQLR